MIRDQHWQEVCNMFGIEGFCRAYRSLVTKRHPENNPSSNKAKPEAEDNFKSIDETIKALNNKNHEGRSMNGVRDFRHNGEGTQGDDPASPRGFFRNRSINNSFRSMPSPLSRSTSFTSLSRSASGRSRTPTPVAAASSLLRSMSRKNADAAAFPEGGSLSRSSSSSWKDPTTAFPEGGSLSRSSSQKGPTTTFPEGGSLSRSSSRKASTTAFPEGGSLSKSSSRKGSTAASPEGGSLLRSSSRKASTTAVPAGGSLARSSSRKASMPIMYSNSNGLIKRPAMEKNLECTLEELCFGCTKKITITRYVITNNGQIGEQEEMLTIKVKPGWARGTKITFEGVGNERLETQPADIIFVIAERRHTMYRREGEDLELAVEIPLVKALTGCTLSVPLLGGEKMSLTIDNIIPPAYVKIIAGQGMPKSKEQGNRGNLIIKFLVQFPAQLTEKQRADVLVSYRILVDHEI